ncbi:MAG: SAM-dependent chlorinase/fluorinase, partial [Acidimicrobiales bacterium]|nr:SAM-dependent chlorinase/fluorinase [Acidimicrobiales bacterium]
LSDYGSSDEFTGVVRSVLRRLSPPTVVIDLCHEVPPHDVRSGALMLARASPWLAPGVVLAVVDPGVGGPRRGVAVEVADERGLVLIGPDNGLLMPAIASLGGARQAVELARPRAPTPGAFGSAGPTFDGRDLFAPAAARFCNGAPLAELGGRVDPATLVQGPVPSTRREGSLVVTEVVGSDRFGNLQLAATAADVASLGSSLSVETASGGDRHLARRVEAFGELAEDELGALIDSSGLVALVLDRRSAARALGAGPGDQVRLGRGG